MTNVVRWAEELKQFQLDLADPLTTAAVNEALSKGHAASFADVLKYYESRPKLARYTIQSELPRMSYRVVTLEGETISDTERIQEYFEQLFGATDEDGVDFEYPEVHLLFRMANQSLLADMMVELHSHFVQPHDPDGRLCVSVHNLSTRFEVDCSDQSVKAYASFAFGTLAGVTSCSSSSDMNSKLTKPCPARGENELLSLGTIDGEISVDVSFEECRAKVFGLKLAMVLDDQLLPAAAAIAEFNSNGDPHNGFDNHSSAAHNRNAGTPRNRDALREALWATTSGGLEIVGESVKVGAVVGEGVLSGGKIFGQVAAGVGSTVFGGIGSGLLGIGGSLWGGSPKQAEEPLQFYRRDEKSESKPEKDAVGQTPGDAESNTKQSERHDDTAVAALGDAQTPLDRDFKQLFRGFD